MENYYPPISVFKSGPSCKCPRCGRGKLYQSYLKLAGACNNCGLSYSFADGGDGAAWFVMLFACVFGVGPILALSVANTMSFFTLIFLSVLLLIAMPLVLLPPAKAMLIAQQWKMDAKQGEEK